MLESGDTLDRRALLRAGAAAAATFPFIGKVVGELLGGEGRAHAAPRARDVTLAWIAQQQAAQSNQRTLAGFQQWLKNKGYNWNVTVSDAKGDPNTLSNMVVDATIRRVDAIIVAFGTLTAAQGALQAVAKAGTPFISIDSGWFPPALCDIASNNYVMGSYMSEYMVQRLLTKGKAEPNIVTITANFHHGTRKRGKVRDQVLTENRNIKVLGDRVIQYTGFYETTLNQVNDWLTRFGRDIDAIWCPWDEPAQAAAQAILNRGYSVEDIFVVGADGHPPAVEEMRDPRYPMVATAAQSFELWGALGGYFVEQIVGLGRPVKEVIPVPIIDLPAPFIVKEVNMPPKGKLPWETTDFYYVFEQQVRGAV